MTLCYQSQGSGLNFSYSDVMAMSPGEVVDYHTALIERLEADAVQQGRIEG